MSKIFRLSFGFLILFVIFITFYGGKVYAAGAGFTNICNSPTGAPTSHSAECPAGGYACYIGSIGSCCITSSNNGSYCTSDIYGQVRRCVCNTGNSYVARCDSGCSSGHSGTVYMNAGCGQSVQLDVLDNYVGTPSFLTYYGGSCVTAPLGKLTGNIYLASDPSDHHPTVYPGCNYTVVAEGHAATDPGFDLTDIQVFYKTPSTSYGSHSASADDTCPGGTCWSRKNISGLYTCGNHDSVSKVWTAPATLGTYQFAVDVADHCTDSGCDGSCSTCCRHSKQEWCAGTTMTAYSDQSPIVPISPFSSKCFSGAPWGSDYIYPGYYRLDVDVVAPPTSAWGSCTNGVHTRTVTTCSGTTTETQACECTGTNIDRNWVTPAVGPSNGAPAIPVKTTGTPEPRIANYSTSPASVTWVPSLAEGASSPAKVNGATYAVGTSFAVDLAAADSSPSTYGVDTLTVATTPVSTTACPPKNICVVQRPSAPSAAGPVSYWKMDEVVGPITSGLVSRWKMDETSGTSVADSASGNTGTATATTTIGTGHSGETSDKARVFNGTSSTVAIANESNFDFERTSSFSIDAWINYTAQSPVSTEMILSKLDSSAPNRGYEFRVTNANLLSMTIIGTYSSSYLQVRGSTVITSGVWHHVAVTYDGSSVPAGIKFYLDGVSDTVVTETNTLTTSPTILNNITPYIGSRNGNSYWFKGSIDDVKVYNRALTLAEVQQEAEKVVADSVGTYPGTNPGTATATTIVASQANHVNARNFNGTSSRIVMPVNVYDSYSEGTIEAWVKPGTISNGKTIFSYSDRSSVSGYRFNILLTPLPALGNTVLQVYVKNSAGTTVFNATTPTTAPISSNVWHHVAYTSSSTGNAFYIDGVLQNLQPTTDYHTGTATDNFFLSYVGAGTNNVPVIGAENTNNVLSSFFTGAIDDVRIYNYALSGSQINSDINSTNVGTARLSGNNAIFNWQAGSAKGCTRETIGVDEYCTACSYDYYVEWGNASGNYTQNSGWLPASPWYSERNSYTTTVPVCGTVFWRVRRGTGYTSGAVGVENWSTEYSFDTGLTCSYPPTATINFTSDSIRRVKVFNPGGSGVSIGVKGVADVAGGSLASVTTSGGAVGDTSRTNFTTYSGTNSSCSGTHCEENYSTPLITTQGNYYFKVGASTPVPTLTCDGDPYCNSFVTGDLACDAGSPYCASCASSYNCNASKQDYVMAIVCPLSNCGGPTLPVTGAVVLGASSKPGQVLGTSTEKGKVLGTTISNIADCISTSGCDQLNSSDVPNLKLRANVPWPADYSACMLGQAKIQIRRGDSNFGADPKNPTVGTYETNYSKKSTTVGADHWLTITGFPDLNDDGYYNYSFPLSNFGTSFINQLKTDTTVPYYWRVVRFMNTSDTDYDGLATDFRSFWVKPNVTISGNIYTGANLACQAVTGSPSIAYWKLDDGTVGQTSIAAVDSVGSNTGTATGTTVVAGKTGFGNARSFNGTSDYISINSVNPFLNNFTVEAWVNFSALNKGSDNAILGHGTTNPNYNGLHLAERSGKAYFGFYFDDLSGNTSLTANRWYHLAFVYDGGKKIYLDGSLDASGTSVSYQSTLMNAEIGRYPWLPSYMMSGIIDDVKIYNYARTSAQVLEDYRGPMIGTLLTTPSVHVTIVADPVVSDDSDSGYYAVPTPWSNIPMTVTVSDPYEITSTCSVTPNSSQTLNLGVALKSTSPWIQVSNGDVYVWSYGLGMSVPIGQSLLTATIPALNTCGVAISGGANVDPRRVAGSCTDHHVENVSLTGSNPKNYLTTLAGKCAGGCGITNVPGVGTVTVKAVPIITDSLSNPNTIYVSGGNITFTGNSLSCAGVLAGNSITLSGSGSPQIKATINPAIYLAPPGDLGSVGVSHTSWKELN